MIQTIKLLLPGLIPSWKFFKAIEPSPRVQWCMMDEAAQSCTDWQEYRPRPTHISAGSMLRRIFWNPNWNEALYMVSLAERLSLSSSTHSRDEIFKRLKLQLIRTNAIDAGRPCLQFRLVFVLREGTELVQQITYLSKTRRISDIVA